MWLCTGARRGSTCGTSTPASLAAPMPSSKKRANASPDSQTSTTSSPSSVGPATWEINPSGGSDSRKPMASIRRSYCSVVMPWISATTMTVITAPFDSSLAPPAWNHLDVGAARARRAEDEELDAIRARLECARDARGNPHGVPAAEIANIVVEPHAATPADDHVQLFLLVVAMPEGASRTGRKPLVAEPRLLTLERPGCEAGLETRPEPEPLRRVLQLLQVLDRVVRHSAPVSVVPAQPGVDDRHVAVALLHERRVRRGLEDHLLGLRDSRDERLLQPGCRLVEAARYDERRHLNAVESVEHLPIPDRAGDMELGRTVHRVVDGRVLRNRREARHQLLRPLVEPAEMPPVEDHAGLLVLGIIGRPGFLVAPKRGLDLRGQLLPEPVALRDEVRERRGGVGEHERAQAGRLSDPVLLREEAAPRRAEHVIPIADAELLDEVRELPDEELHGPEVAAAVGQVRGSAVAELVVEDERAARAG